MRVQPLVVVQVRLAPQKVQCVQRLLTHPCLELRQSIVSGKHVPQVAGPIPIPKSVVIERRQR